VLYACRNEYALTAVDVIARRLRLAFLNSESALAALPRVIALMAEHFGWDSERRLNEYFRASEFLRTMNKEGRKLQLLHPTDHEKLLRAEKTVRTFFEFSPIDSNELEALQRAFTKVDTDGDGRIKKSEVLRVIKEAGVAPFRLGDAPTLVDLPPNAREFLSRLLHTSEEVEWNEFLFTAAVLIGHDKAKNASTKSTASGPWPVDANQTAPSPRS